MADTPQPQAVDYSGRPLTEGDPVAFLSHDPIGLTAGRIRVISPQSICIATGPHLVTFSGVPASLGTPRPRPITGTVRRDEDFQEPFRYSQVALQPAAPVREQKDRPTHPDGTPYSYAEMTAEGWEHCDGCHTWSTATPQRPHECPEVHISGPAAGGA